MAGPAAIRIGAVRRRSLEIAGLKVFSSLQGPAGERRTIYREACVAEIAIAIDIGNDFGSKPAMLAATAARGLGRLCRIAPRKRRIAEEKILSPAQSLMKFEKSARCRS